MEKLEELLGAELYAQVATKLGEKKLLIDDGSFIPDHRFKEKVAEVKALKDAKAQVEADLEKLKPLTINNEALTAQVAQVKADSEARTAKYEAEQARVRKAFAIKESLMNAGASDPEARDLLALKFDIEKVELDEKGNVKGFDEMVKPMQDSPSLKNLFGKTKIKGQEHNEGKLDITLGEHAKNNPFSKATRNISKQIELLRDKPELAKKLQESAIA